MAVGNDILVLKLGIEINVTKSVKPRSKQTVAIRIHFVTDAKIVVISVVLIEKKTKILLNEFISELLRKQTAGGSLANSVHTFNRNVYQFSSPSCAFLHFSCPW